MRNKKKLIKFLSIYFIIRTCYFMIVATYYRSKISGKQNKGKKKIISDQFKCNDFSSSIKITFLILLLSNADRKRYQQTKKKKISPHNMTRSP